MALPASRGLRVAWLQLLTVLPAPYGLIPLFTVDWKLFAACPDRSGHLFGSLDPSTGTAILTFLGTRSPRSGSLWLTDVAHHHLALGLVALLLGHIIHVASVPRLAVSSLHFQLALGLASLGTASSFTANHLDAFTVYAFLCDDLVAMSALFTHHQYIAGFLVSGAFAHGAIYLIRDASVGAMYTNDSPIGKALRWLIQNRAAVVTHLSAISLFLGFHTLGLFVHNDVMQALGTPEKQIAVLPVFAEWLQAAHGGHLGTSLTAGDFLVHHAIALGLHVTTLVFLKAALNARSSKLMPDKATFGYGFPCDGPGRGGTCDISAFDGFYLAVFWMLNTVGWITFYWHWKHLTLATGNVGLWRDGSLYLMGWLRDYLWLNSAQLINGYSPTGGNAFAIWDWLFLFGHLVWATGFMFLISWRGYWQELIEAITWAHEHTLVANLIAWQDKPVALSIVQARLVGLVHFSVGYVLTYGPFVIAASLAAGTS